MDATTMISRVTSKNTAKIIEIARFLQANNLDIDLTLLILLFFINTVKWLPAVGSVATLLNALLFPRSFAVRGYCSNWSPN